MWQLGYVGSDFSVRLPPASRPPLLLCASFGAGFDVPACGVRGRGGGPKLDARQVHQVPEVLTPTRDEGGERTQAGPAPIPPVGGGGMGRSGH